MKFTTFIIVTFLLCLVSYTLSLSKRNNHKKLKHHKSLKSHKKFHSGGIIIGVNKVEREQIVEIVNDIRNQIATTASYNKVGDWGLGIGDWGLGPIPNPQSPIPNPQSPIP
jgi:hypothetical protein